MSSRERALALPAPHLLDLGLQVSELDALLQVSAPLLRRQLHLLLLLVEELQQVLHPCGHVHVPVTQQLHPCGPGPGGGGPGEVRGSFSVQRP